MHSKKRVAVIGAGPGGLAAGMILAHRGHDVTVYEKKEQVGGRTSAQKISGFTFELGPTFVMLPQAFEEVFAFAGKQLADYVELKQLDTLYRLSFADGREFRVAFDKAELKAEIARLFPGDEESYESYMRAQKRKFDKMYPCLKIPYSSWYSYFNPKLLKALPFMDVTESLYGILARFFKHEDMRISMTFQAKYLGMSPWDCPGPFSILSYIEHAYGIYHPMGGVHKLTEAMAKVLEENGGRIRLGSGVSRILVRNGRASGVRLESGVEADADFVVLNADFGEAMASIVPEEFRGRWTRARLEKSPFSCSTFMLYLGLNKRYDIPHHNIFFSGDYKNNIEEIAVRKVVSADPSFYIQNACATDPSLAPPGKSTIYVLVPVPNLESAYDWGRGKAEFRELIIRKIAERTEMKDIESAIEAEIMITPDEWKNERYVYKGAVFNLAHTLGQMLYLRPHNEFESFPGLYLTGGGTHPGSGLPTIVESGRIVADLLTAKSTL